MPTPRVVCLVALALAMLAAPAASPAASPAVRPPRPIEKVYVPLEIFADTLAKKKSVAVAHAWADSVGRAATARGDRAHECRQSGVSQERPAVQPVIL